MGHPGSSKTTSTEFVLNHISFIENLSKANRIEKFSQFREIMLFPRLRSHFDLEFFILSAHKVSEVFRFIDCECDATEVLTVVEAGRAIAFRSFDGVTSSVICVLHICW